MGATRTTPRVEAVNRPHHRQWIISCTHSPFSGRFSLPSSHRPVSYDYSYHHPTHVLWTTTSLIFSCSIYAQFLLQIIPSCFESVMFPEMILHLSYLFVHFATFRPGWKYCLQRAMTRVTIAHCFLVLQKVDRPLENNLIPPCICTVHVARDKIAWCKCILVHRVNIQSVLRASNKRVWETTLAAVQTPSREPRNVA